MGVSRTNMALLQRKVGQSISTFLDLINSADQSTSDSNKNAEKGLLQNHNVLVKSVNYNLDREKTVGKKLDAVNRTELYSANYTTVNGKNLVLHCQAGLYELLRKAVLAYFLHFKSHVLECETTILQEKGSGLNVQATHRIRNMGGGNVNYTVNLYHTKSSILVNGKGTDTFIDIDFPYIVDIINQSSPISPSLLNEQVRGCFEAIARCVSSEKSGNLVRASRRSKIQHDSVTEQSGDSVTEQAVCDTSPAGAAGDVNFAIQHSVHLPASVKSLLLGEKPQSSPLPEPGPAFQASSHPLDAPGSVPGDHAVAIPGKKIVFNHSQAGADIASDLGNFLEISPAGASYVSDPRHGMMVRYSDTGNGPPPHPIQTLTTLSVNVAPTRDKMAPVGPTVATPNVTEIPNVHYRYEDKVSPISDKAAPINSTLVVPTTVTPKVTNFTNLHYQPAERSPIYGMQMHGGYRQMVSSNSHHHTIAQSPYQMVPASLESGQQPGHLLTYDAPQNFKLDAPLRPEEHTASTTNISHWAPHSQSNISIQSGLHTVTSGSTSSRLGTPITATANTETFETPQPPPIRGHKETYIGSRN